MESALSPPDEPPAGPQPIGFGARIHELAGERPGEVALVVAAEDGGELDVTWRELTTGRPRSPAPSPGGGSASVTASPSHCGTRPS